MPRYFFDITDNDGIRHDDVGVELDSFDSARKEAQAFLPILAHEKIPIGEYNSIVCKVRDENGKVIYWGSLTYRGERTLSQDDDVFRSMYS